jgi:hypothetical protein
MESGLHKMILVGFLIISHALQAQETEDFTYYNQVTYDHYLKKEWDQLIEVGSKALNQDFDFYYLRARLGIAYYEKWIFTAAIRHFRKALNYNSSEPVMLEYLYYSYIYSSRYLDASLLYHKHKKIMSELSLTWIPKFFDGMSLDGAYKWSNHRTSLGTETGNIAYAQTAFHHAPGGRLYIYHYAGFLNHTFTDKYIRENFYTRYRYYFNQFDYYVNAHLMLGFGFEINPTYHFMGVNANSVKYSDSYFGIGIKKRLGRVSLGFHYGSANVNDTAIKQFIPQFLYYPLGNTKFYISASSIFCMGDLNQQVHNGLVGIRLFPVTWLEGFISYGKSQYISLFEGAIIYNNPDFLLSRAGISLTHYLTPKTSLMLHYVSENKEQISSGDPYIHHVFAIGINFKF